MLLSEKASAFFIDNLISKSETSSKKEQLQQQQQQQQNNEEYCSSSGLSVASSSSSLLINTTPISPGIGLPRKKTFKSSYEYHIKSSSFSSSQSSASPQLSPRSSCSPQNANTNGDEPEEEPPQPQPQQLQQEQRCSKKRKLNDQDDDCARTKQSKGGDEEGAQSQLKHYEMNSATKAKIETFHGDEDSDLNDLECYLETDDLWKRFHELGTEMIITKSGRRMFPPLRVSFLGAKLSEKYLIAMDIVPIDNKRYRYAYHRSSWLVAGKADPPANSRLYVHPDGPFTGDTLYKQIVSFEKVKLTNNEMDKSGHVND